MHLRSKHINYFWRTTMSKNIKKISKDKIKESNNAEYKTPYKPKKYHSAFLNTVNRDAHSSRPETVGKLATEIFPNYVENAIEPNPENWKKYYQDNHSEQYDSGLEKLKKQFEVEKQAINSITEQDLVDYYDDLMFTKTFSGLYAQEEILKDIAANKNATYRKPNAIEEGQGIDGYIDDVPYSVKSETYKDSAAKNNETIKAKMVYYCENKKDKSIDYYIEEENEQ